MRSLQTLLLIGTMLLTGCEGVVFFSTGFHPTNTLVTISGFVSVIQITTIIGAGGTTTLVTVVTFLQSGTVSTIDFCGNGETGSSSTHSRPWISPKAKTAGRSLQYRPDSDRQRVQ